jgi:hypothetical protein
MNDFINIIDTDTGKQVQFVDSRYYTKDYKSWYPGVTNVLGVVSKGSQYESWLKSVGFNADAIVREAMEKGSRVHSAIENLLNGMEVTFGNSEKQNFSRDEWIMVARFMDFYTGFKPETIAVEKVLVSDKLQFGTQLDYICKLDGVLWYIDHKTGSIYDSAYRQVAASIQLWNEYFPKTPITKGGILHLDSAHRGRDSKGKSIQGEGWKLVEVTDIDRYWRIFQHIHSIWKDNNPDYKPFNLQYPVSYKLETKEEPKGR